MKSLTLIIFFIFCTSFLFGQNSKINFSTERWDTVLRKAKTEHKPIFIDVYAQWCGPCKWMEKNIFTNDTVARFYNEHFISFKMDLEHDPDKEMFQQYFGAIAVYPTYLYFDSSGKLIYRTRGAQGKPEGFIKVGKKALQKIK